MIIGFNKILHDHGIDFYVIKFVTSDSFRCFQTFKTCSDFRMSLQSGYVSDTDIECTFLVCYIIYSCIHSTG